MSGNLSDLDDLLKELDSVDSSNRRESVQVKAPVKQRNSSQDFDELEKLVAQFDEEKGNNSNKRDTLSLSPKSKHDTLSLAPESKRESLAFPQQNKRDTLSLSKPIDESKRSSVFHKEPPVLSNFNSNLCGSCGQPITGAHIMALGKMFHPGHLTCSNCAVDLQGDFYDLDGKYCCKNCTAQLFPCSVCGRPIEQEYYLGDGKFFHPNCIDRHYCDKCGGEILPTTRKLSALGKHWHADCFRCTGCSSLLDTTFYAKNNSPYCGNCSQSSAIDGSSARCSDCGLDINGGSTFVSYGGRSYHQNCFKCFKCKTVLNHERFYNVGGTSQCESCANL